MIKYYGFHSSQARDKTGCSVYIYELIKGGTARCTHVTSNVDAPNYQWPDKVSLGEVGNFIKEEEGLNRAGTP